ncbi:MAG TPA: HRDC domain-containing protein [Anaerohalosphaeraceae bacterium]|nr:HRDC domain-containing protein [Anaerohalosphaeraceae bacterium]
MYIELPLETQRIFSFEYVQNAQALTAMLEQIQTASRLALDTEADSYHHYYPKVCLIQLSTEDSHFIVDPLADFELKAFFEILCQKNLVLHDAGYDLRMLKASFGFEPKGEIFDTMLAARLIGREHVGLSDLLADFLGVQVHKKNQRADWSKRPLSDELLKYAMDDTCHLLELADILSGKLAELGRLEWHRQSCRWSVRSALQPAKNNNNPDEIWRIAGVSRLKPKEMAFVRELWHWREKEAQKADVPPFRIMYPKQMLALSVWAAAQKKKIEIDPHRLPRSCRGERLASLKRAIEKASQLSPEEWPDRKRPQTGHQPSFEQQSQIEMLRKKVVQIGAALNLSPQWIAPKATLTSIVLRKLNTPEKIIQSNLLTPWQAELLAGALEEAFGESGRL